MVSRIRPCSFRRMAKKLLTICVKEKNTEATGSKHTKQNTCKEITRSSRCRSSAIPLCVVEPRCLVGESVPRALLLQAWSPSEPRCRQAARSRFASENLRVYPTSQHGFQNLNETPSRPGAIPLGTLLRLCVILASLSGGISLSKFSCLLSLSTTPQW